MAAKQTDLLSVNFFLDRDTKGALVYMEADEKGNVIKNDKGYSDFTRCKIGTIYIRKAAFTGAAPRAISVRINGVS